MTKHGYLILALMTLFLGTMSPAYASSPEARAPTSSQAKKSAQSKNQPKKLHAKTINLLLEAYFSDSSPDPAVKILRAAHITYHRVIIKKTLPDKSSALLELSLSNSHAGLRYPIQVRQLKQIDGDKSTVWEVSWAPHIDYARALVELTDSTRLVSTPRGERWDKISRLPALPIIVGPDELTTPLGKISLKKDLGRAAKKTPVPQASKTLNTHVKRWTEQVVRKDPDPANVDILLQRGVSWADATRAIMAPAMQGFYQLYLIGEADGVVRATTSVAPVLKSALKPKNNKKVPVVIAVTQAGAVGKSGSNKSSAEKSSATKPAHATPYWQVRLRIGDKMVAAPATDDAKSSTNTPACPVSATFCARSTEDFSSKTVEILTNALKQHGQTAGQLTLAANHHLPAEDFVNLLGALSESLGVSTSQIFAGFIGD